MKKTMCARCGAPIEVPDSFDLFEDMDICEECFAAMPEGDDE